VLITYYETLQASAHSPIIGYGHVVKKVEKIGYGKKHIQLYSRKLI